MKGTNTIDDAIGQAEGYLTRGMAMDALKTLKGLPAGIENDQRVLELQLECLCHQFAWEETVRLCESVTAELSPLALFWLGVARCQCGDVLEARRALGRAIELDAGFRERIVSEPLLESIWRN